jgi:V/A-type H+-transporting ATPase subunit D
MKEFLRVVESVLQRAVALRQAAARATQALCEAEAVAGPETVRSISMATRGELMLDVETVNVMGVRVPVIEQKTVTRPATGRGFSITGTPLVIDEAAAAFEDEVQAILHLAESELRLARLSREIQSTSRRLNALEHVLLPRLNAEYSAIQMALDERERADHFRLKLVKRAIQRNGK